MRRPKKLDPKTLWVITDSNQPITPPSEAFQLEEFTELWSKLTEEDRQEWLERVKNLAEDQS